MPDMHTENEDKQGMVLYKNLLESMSDGAFVVGYDGRIRLENKIAVETIGIQGKSLCGESLLDLISKTGKNDEFFGCIIDAVYERKKMSRIVPFDQNGKTKHLRLVASPIRDRENDISVMVIISDMTELVELNRKNENLSRKLSDFIDRFVKLMVDAIDARSPYNANHTRNMVRYASDYLDYLDRKGRGISKDHRIAFLTSVWMHDIGKLVIPLGVLDKPSRLGNSEQDVYHRIEVAVLCERIRALESPEKAENVYAAIEKLMGAKKLIEEANGKGHVHKEERDQIREIAGMKCLTPSGEYVPLLTEYEKTALTVPRGTLTAEERKLVESHVTHTYEMLMQMGFGGKFQDVPEWAGKHHEYLDGSGYPNGAAGEDIPWEARLLTIIDVYDALTAEDRPYKPPLPVKKAFGILNSMKDAGKLDGSILEDFIESGAWKKAEPARKNGEEGGHGN